MTLWSESAQVSRRKTGDARRETEDGRHNYPPDHNYHHSPSHTATRTAGRCGSETNLELPVMKLLGALDVPLRAQVAESPELFPSTADGPFVDLEDAGR